MLHLSEALCFVRDHPFTAISLVILLAILANSIYNRYFHPLRHFPGPVLAGITDFWKLFVVFSKNIHVKELDLHEKYGLILYFQNFL
jgi:hypothetical protein